MSRKQCPSTSSRCKWLIAAVVLGSLLVSLSFHPRPEKTTTLVIEPIQIPSDEEVSKILTESNSKSCMDLGKAYTEPDDRAFRYGKIDLEGPIYAHYNWTQPIQKFQIDVQRNLTNADCRMLFKILDRKLYVQTDSYCTDKKRMRRHATLEQRHVALQEMLLITLAVYEVPDVDFAVNLDDRTIDLEYEGHQLPVMSYSLRLASRKKLRYYASPAPPIGFTIPSYGVYWDGLGRQQMAFVKKCLALRYPSSDRTKKTVWRGSTTGTEFESAKDVYANRRVALAFLGSKASDVLDIGIIDYVQVTGRRTEVYKSMRALAPLHHRIPMEDYNKYVGVVDVDGNAWSDRLPWLLTSNTPIIKQEYSSWKEYFGHLLTSDHVVFFEEDLSDLVKKSEEVIQTWESKRSKWEKRTEKAFAFAQEHISQQGMIRAMAYALTKYASFTNWTVTMEDGYAAVDPKMCCKSNVQLPKELVKRVQNGESNEGKV